MIVLLHVATGAAVGALVGRRARVVVLAPLVHGLGDIVPHRDISSKPLETVSGIVAVLLLAARRGPLDAATLGGAFAAAPDLEHILPVPRFAGRPLFPTHRFRSLHHGGGLPVWAQLALAAALLGPLLRRAKRGGPGWPVRQTTAAGGLARPDGRSRPRASVDPG